MSNVNILRAVENIRSGTTVYTPLVEIIVNAIQAIEGKGNEAGQIDVVVERSSQEELEKKVPPVESFLIKDNGIGFTDANRDSFDTLYSDYKLSQGGKGFGRFICLKYFEDLEIESIYQDGKEFKSRKFRMGKSNDIIVDEECADSEETETRTSAKLMRVKDEKFTDKELPTIARVLAERLLPYFINQDYNCPSISISESDGSGRIVLNDFVSNQLSTRIKEIRLSSDNFSLQGNNIDYGFRVRLFKFYAPKNQRSKISLVAHRREVTDTAIHNYIPEFIEEFYDKQSDGSDDRDRNYVLKAYVFGDYLDENVSLERGGFEFQRESDLIHGVSQADIEKEAAEISKAAIGDEITARQEKKKERVQSYVDDEAPWHRPILNSVDLSSMPYNSSKEEIELILQKEKHRQEIEVTGKIGKLLKEGDIDERLNFTNYVSSDKPLNDGVSDRPDLLAYDRRVLFRGDNESSNPVTIFEFKKPQRDDFVNPSSTDDPIKKIVRYVNQVREGKFKTPEGRKILVSDNTPFYGYVVCDLTTRVEKWLEYENEYKPMPDKLGWFRWHNNINLYLEAVSWDKVLRDAKMRNRIFFHKLGIS